MANGTPLPEGAAASEGGTPATDPEKAVMSFLRAAPRVPARPLVVELFTGASVGEPTFPAFRSEKHRSRKYFQNSVLCAFESASSTTRAPQLRPSRELRNTRQGLPVADSANGVHYPGERSASVAGPEPRAAWRRRSGAN
ncbi:hypothetical protein [Streptomyces sp. NPDC001100]